MRSRRGVRQLEERVAVAGQLFVAPAGQIMPGQVRQQLKNPAAIKEEHAVNLNDIGAFTAEPFPMQPDRLVPAELGDQERVTEPARTSDQDGMPRQPLPRVTVEVDPAR